MNKVKTDYELFSHQADMGIRGVGKTAKEAFEQAGCALTSVATDLDLVEPQTAVEIKCSAPSLEILFYDWIGMLVYEASCRNMLFNRFKIHKFNGKSLEGTAWGESVNVQKHQPSVEVKGPTLTCLEVTQSTDGSWIAQCVVDV